jgi:hypothetical protein
MNVPTLHDLIAAENMITVTLDPTKMIRVIGQLNARISALADRVQVLEDGRSAFVL